ncbi:nitroimidazol reductase NimA-like FMN-containing flavoprotein (pyridoxamine 5'-phosphate oxidase superfamily) [Crossiella equi]|uniref:Nitroimidazol reductase NimA-like FMN-containing flavoprotein (Pyridoxamine 5'-phosphate oxidase superfamily) n=1 Tax=Crossiella equi TaxID=130796 RepID=A0ABS5AK64_9PSEU|nr:pyridoxamine 5'-phosphate oxidase family protein [Crossiella equi]MBP2476974.1 nitroimidazol reductase NimA-like FMN-containing flavoprotein (pyridoxamine 5'-phosphate oxidase superfamily) [Crossiella equi]
MTETSLSPTDRSTIRRGKKRAVTDRAALAEVLDAGFLCHLGVVREGSPLVLPTCYGRDGDTLYLHGSSGAASLRAGAGAEVCVTVTHLDGVVYARSVFNFSANYRSAVVHGRAEPVVEEAAKLHGLRVLTEQIAPGSWDHARQPNRRELAATAVLRLDLTEAAVKIRTGPPVDEEEDLALPAWAGVLPLHRSWGTPVPAPELPEGAGVPAHVQSRTGPVA